MGEVKGDRVGQGRLLGCIVHADPGYLGTGLLSWSTTWPQTGFQIHTACGLDGPSVIAIRSPATEAFAELLVLGFGLRLVDISQPVRRMGHRPRVDEDGLVLLRVCRAGPEPILG